MRTLIWIAATITIAITTTGSAFGQARGRVRAVAPSPQGRVVYVPYGAVNPYYSGYVGGYGYADPFYGAPYAPNGAGYYPGTQPPYGYDPNAPAPAVIVNQNFQPDTLHPMINDYSNVPLPPPGAVQTPPSAAGAPNVQQLNQSGAQPLGGAPLRDDQPTIFLIAMKDHTIYPV